MRWRPSWIPPRFDRGCSSWLFSRAIKPRRKSNFDGSADGLTSIRGFQCRPINTGSWGNAGRRPNCFSERLRVRLAKKPRKRPLVSWQTIQSRTPWQAIVMVPRTIVLALCRDFGIAQKLIDSSVNPIAAQTLYLRGLNFLRARKGTEAAAEFQTPLDHKGANWGPYYPAAYVGLARATSMVGNTHRGKKSYEDFLALWKEADAEIPLLIQARTEYAALK